jgi:hypothetical protein
MDSPRVRGDAVRREHSADECPQKPAPHGELRADPLDIPAFPNTVVPSGSPAPALARDFLRVTVIHLERHLVGNRGADEREGVPSASAWSRSLGAIAVSALPPPAPPPPPGMVWGSLPDPGGVARAALTWPTTTGITYAVYTADVRPAAPAHITASLPRHGSGRPRIRCSRPCWPARPRGWDTAHGRPGRVRRPGWASRCRRPCRPPGSARGRRCAYAP